MRSPKKIANPDHPLGPPHHRGAAALGLLRSSAALECREWRSSPRAPQRPEKRPFIPPPHTASHSPPPQPSETRTARSPAAAQSQQPCCGEAPRWARPNKTWRTSRPGGSSDPPAFPPRSPCDLRDHCGLFLHQSEAVSPSTSSPRFLRAFSATSAPPRFVPPPARAVSPITDHPPFFSSAVRSSPVLGCSTDHRSLITRHFFRLS